MKVNATPRFSKLHRQVTAVHAEDRAHEESHPYFCLGCKVVCDDVLVRLNSLDKRLVVGHDFNCPCFCVSKRPIRRECNDISGEAAP